MIQTILVCGIASCLGVAGLWALGAPFDWSSATITVLVIWALSAITAIKTEG